MIRYYFQNFYIRNRITFQMTCVNWVVNLHFWILIRKVDLNEFKALQFVHVVLLHVFHFSLFLRLGYTWKMCTTFGCDRGAARPASRQAGLEYRRRGETTNFPLSTSVGKFATTTLHCTATRVRTTRTLLAKEVLEIEWKRWKCSRRSFFQWRTELGLFLTFWSMVVVK